MADPSESEIQSASDMLENARKGGRIVTAKQMTPAAQIAQKRLLAKQQPKSTSAFDTAEQELARRKSGVGGKYMVK